MSASRLNLIDAHAPTLNSPTSPPLPVLANHADSTTLATILPTRAWPTASCEIRATIVAAVATVAATLFLLVSGLLATATTSNWGYLPAAVLVIATAAAVPIPPVRDRGRLIIIPTTAFMVAVLAFVTPASVLAIAVAVSVPVSAIASWRFARSTFETVRMAVWRTAIISLSAAAVVAIAPLTHGIQIVLPSDSIGVLAVTAAVTATTLNTVFNWLRSPDSPWRAQSRTIRDAAIMQTAIVAIPGAVMWHQATEQTARQATLTTYLAFLLVVLGLYVWVTQQQSLRTVRAFARFSAEVSDSVWDGGGGDMTVTEAGTRSHEHRLVHLAITHLAQGVGVTDVTLVVKPFSANDQGRVYQSLHLDLTGPVAPTAIPLSPGAMRKVQTYAATPEVTSLPLTSTSGESVGQLMVGFLGIPAFLRHEDDLANFAHAISHYLDLLRAKYRAAQGYDDQIGNDFDQHRGTASPTWILNAADVWHRNHPTPSPTHAMVHIRVKPSPLVAHADHASLLQFDPLHDTIVDILTGTVVEVWMRTGMITTDDADGFFVLAQELFPGAVDQQVAHFTNLARTRLTAATGVAAGDVTTSLIDGIPGVPDTDATVIACDDQPFTTGIAYHPSSDTTPLVDLMALARRYSLTGDHHETGGTLAAHVKEHLDAAQPLTIEMTPVYGATGVVAYRPRAAFYPTSGRPVYGGQLADMAHRNGFANQLLTQLLTNTWQACDAVHSRAPEATFLMLATDRLLLHHDLPALLRHLLASPTTSLNPQRITLILTCSPASDHATLRSAFQALAAYGITVGIADVEPGSAAASLCDHPAVRYVVVSPSLVQAIDTVHGQTAIRQLADTAHSRGQTVVALDVVDDSIIPILHGCGVDLVETDAVQGALSLQDIVSSSR